MRSLVTALFLLCASLCSARGGATALEVHGASPKAWRSVQAVVHSFGTQYGFRLARKSAKDLVYDVDPPGQPSTTTLFVSLEFDTIRIEMVEDAAHASRRHRALERELRARLESAGLRFSPTESSIVITH